MKRGLVSKISSVFILGSIIFFTGCNEKLRQTTYQEKEQCLTEQIDYTQRTGNPSPKVVPQLIYKY
tara:strand:- start:2174 stop:2371 length:198 start_codon:yes stop_codon:yes gene_type:complete